MHCYFNLSNGVQRIIDHEGIEVKDEAEAREQAKEAVREVIAEDDSEKNNWRGWFIEVTTVSGDILCKIDVASDQDRAE